MTEAASQNGAGRLGVSLIATVFNEADNIGRFAGSILAQTRRPDEVVIVDGGSTDGTPEVICRELEGRVPLRIIVAPGLNISQGRNRAIAEAAGPLIAASDAGCVLRPDWLEKLVAPLEADAAVSVASGFYSMDCHSLLQQCVGLATMPGQLDPVNGETFLPSSRSVAFRKAAWETVGGYPEWLYTGEDTLFDLKLKRMGFRFRFVGEAIVEWEPRRSWRAVYRQFFLYARGGGHLGTCRDDILWDLKRLAAVVAIGVAGAFFWPLWLLWPLLFIYDHVNLVHARAARVARKLGSFKAYVVTSAALWMIRVARSFGQVSGTWQRHKDPERYVQGLDAYMANAGGRPPNDVQDWGKEN